MEFIDYLKEREAKLIKTVGENNWRENKAYLVDEIIQMVKEYERRKHNPTPSEKMNEELEYARQCWKENRKIDAVIAVRHATGFDLFMAKRYCDKNF